MSTGVGAAANCSQAFYVPPGVEVVTIELPFTHNANMAVHRYHNDWLSLKSTPARCRHTKSGGALALPVLFEKHTVRQFGSRHEVDPLMSIPCRRGGISRFGSEFLSQR